MEEEEEEQLQRFWALQAGSPCQILPGKKKVPAGAISAPVSLVVKVRAAGSL